MKTFTKILIASILAVALASCSGYKTASVYDDVYYSPDEEYAGNQSASTSETDYTASDQEDQDEYTTVEPDKASDNTDTNYQENNRDNSAPAETESETYYSSDESGDTYVTNNYYDYSYSSRIRRFHSGNSMGFGYYDPYFTNMYYYNHNPYHYGTSIYYGYDFWYPRRYGYYRPYYSSGWGYFGHGYGFGYGYSPYYSGYGSYWSGYNHGYWNGYHDGY
ncbi:MAG: hypothetical protein ACOCPM_02500, partial [Bacteroidales bacterium]